MALDNEGMKTRRMIAVSAMTIGLLGPTQSAAQTGEEIAARYSRTWQQCMDMSGGNTGYMMECSGLEFDRQDTRLNQAYKTTMARLTSRQKITLRSFQRKWIRQRNARCDKESEPENGGFPGSIHRIIYSACILHETIKRTIWIERYKPGNHQNRI